MHRDLREIVTRGPSTLCGIVAAVIGSAVVGAGTNIAASKSAAKNSKKATNASIAAEQAQSAQTRADEAPFTQSGYGAVNALNSRFRIAPQSSTGQVIGSTAGASGVIGPATGAPAAQPTTQPAAGVIDLTRQADGSWARPQTIPAAPDTGVATTPSPTGATPAPAPTSVATTANTTPGPDGTSNGYVPPGTYGDSKPGGYSDLTLDQFKGSPGFQYQLDNALKGTMATSAATGALRSGAAAKALQDRAQGLALQDFNNERGFQRGVYENDRNYLTGRYDTETGGLFDLAKLGQAAASGTAAAGQSSTNGIVNALQTNGANQGAAALSGANSVNSLLGAGVNALTYNATQAAAQKALLAQNVSAGVAANPLLF